MTNSLAARAKALREKLVILDELGANVEEASRLEGLRSDLATAAARLIEARGRYRLLAKSGIETAEPSSLGAVRKRGAMLLEKFTAETTAATLTRGKSWADLIKDLEKASDELGSGVLASWKGYRQSVFTGEAPSVLKSRIAMTPENDAVFKIYEKLHQIFRGEFDKLPADALAIDRVKDLAARLNETVKTFDFAVPADVKSFFEATQTGGAKLELLTDAVLEWLRKKKEVENYCIVPRSADGRR